ELATEQGIECDVLDLRSLYPLDLNAVLKSVEKTGKVLIALEDKVTGGFGGELSALITEHAFQSLDAPVMRVGSIFTPVALPRCWKTPFFPIRRRSRQPPSNLRGGEHESLQLLVFFGRFNSMSGRRT